MILNDLTMSGRGLYRYYISLFFFTGFLNAQDTTLMAYAVSDPSINGNIMDIAYDRGFNDGLTNRSISALYYSEEHQKVAYLKGYDQGKVIRKSGTHWYMNSGLPTEKFTDLKGWSAKRALSSLRSRGFTISDTYSHGNTLYATWYNESTTQCIIILIRDNRILETLVSSHCN